MQVGQCFEKALSTFKLNPAPFVLGTLVMLVTNGIIGYLSRYFAGISLLNVFVSGPLMGGMTLMALAARRGQPFDVPQVFDGFKRAVPFIVVNLVISLGAIACGIGILVTAFLFMFANVFVALGADFGPALTRSKDIAVAHAADTAVLMAVIFGLYLGGAILCGVGLLVTIPLAILVLIEGLEQIRPGSVR